MWVRSLQSGNEKKLLDLPIMQIQYLLGCLFSEKQIYIRPERKRS
ncbi:hypothetical protein B0F88_1047 [Methylobacter tundripaludum]|uniref:Uncharacterized protein n=1 Tax=Methylobacter tundripaludum TaxID=173365 RepID=A0A2S6H493_9GAMM|nr:hypothetical protein B0F88_1047 [Methylobacter tundripaludum]